MIRVISGSKNFVKHTKWIWQRTKNAGPRNNGKNNDTSCRPTLRKPSSLSTTPASSAAMRWPWWIARPVVSIASGPRGGSPGPFYENKELGSHLKNQEMTGIYHEHLETLYTIPSQEALNFADVVLRRQRALSY